jgi:type I restriction enzyme R subunit
VFEDDGDTVVKKIAGYHQFHAVQGARAHRARLAPAGRPRVGVVWHTQGSGKSLTMAFYAGRVVLHPAMENPTLVVLTDRNDLDEQLFGTFARCQGPAAPDPEQAESRAHLRELLKVASGGVVFTTIQKFLPESAGGHVPAAVRAPQHRRHRRRGAPQPVRLHRRLRGATCATRCRTRRSSASPARPSSSTDKNTRAVFGDYISVYDIQRAVEDGATVPIYYESRLAKLELEEGERPKLDEEFEELTEGEELEGKEKLKTKWAALEAAGRHREALGLIAATSSSTSRRASRRWTARRWSSA